MGLYCEDVAGRFGVVCRAWHGVGDAVIKHRVEAFSKAMWGFPALLKEHWDSTLTCTESGDGDGMQLYSSKPRKLTIELQMSIKPLTGSCLRDGTMDLSSFG